MPTSRDDTKRREELAKEQSLTVLEQALGDREQLAGDREQARIDHEQVNHDDRRQHDTTSDHREDCINDDRQARIDREQLSRDVSQESIDHAQEGRDNQQQALDNTRARLNLPRSQQPDAADASLIAQGATDRARAARERAETALIRAQAAMTRAQAAETRAQKNDPTNNRSADAPATTTVSRRLTPAGSVHASLRFWGRSRTCIPRDAGPVPRRGRCSSECESRGPQPDSAGSRSGTLVIRSGREFCLFVKEEASAVVVRVGRCAQVVVLMSSLAIQLATFSGYGARSPRTMCWKPALMACVIACWVVAGCS
jgi:hypothetical protein